MKPDDEKQILCAVSGVSLPKDEGVKLVVSPQQQLVVDLEDSLDMPHQWVCFSPAVMGALQQHETRVKLFDDDVQIATDFASRLELRVRKQCLQWLALAKKAGSLTVGGQKAKTVLNEGKVQLIFQASEGSERELKKLLQGPYKAVPVCQLFTSYELAGILGQNHIGYLALQKGKLADKIFRRCLLLEKWHSEKRK